MPPRPGARFFLCLLAVALALPTAAAAQDGPFPASPVGDRLRWVVDLLNGGAAEVTTDEVAEQLAPRLLAEIPPADLIATADGLALAGPYLVLGLARPAVDHQAMLLLQPAMDEPLLLTMTVEPDPPHRIAELLIESAPGVQPAGPDDLGDRFDVDGRSLYLWCSGEGGPTVVLEAGAETPPSTYLALQARLAQTTKVCSYDRPNRPGGASDPVAPPRSGADVVGDLKRLLEAAGVLGPYVMVGHGLGGLLVQQYAMERPQAIVGLVLIDPTHEDLADRLARAVDPEQWAAYEATRAGSPAPEGIDLDLTATEIRRLRALRPLWPVPLVVLTPGLPPDAGSLPPGWPAAETLRVAQELYRQIVPLVPGAKVIVADAPGDLLLADQLDLVLAAVLEVVEAVRTPGSWATPELQPAGP